MSDDVIVVGLGPVREACCGVRPPASSTRRGQDEAPRCAARPCCEDAEHPHVP